VIQLRDLGLMKEGEASVVKKRITDSALERLLDSGMKTRPFERDEDFKRGSAFDVSKLSSQAHRKANAVHARCTGWDAVHAAMSFLRIGVDTRVQQVFARTSSSSEGMDGGLLLVSASGDVEDTSASSAALMKEKLGSWVVLPVGQLVFTAGVGRAGRVPGPGRARCLGGEGAC
jgi:hypothetical protein